MAKWVDTPQTAKEKVCDTTYEGKILKPKLQVHTLLVCSRTNSTAAWALLRDKVVAGRAPLLFVVTHFKAGDNEEAAETRRQQADSLSKVIADIKTANPECGPVMLCGDFNGEPSEKFYNVISGIDDMASAYKVTMVV